MSFDFSAQARSAREAIAVPAVPLGAIRARARTARIHERMRVLAASAAIVVALGAGSVAGAKLYSSVRVWLGGGKAALTVKSFDGVREPTSAEFRKAIAQATFPVVLPAGLPDGTRVTAIFSTPAGRPSALVISYENGRTGMKASFVLVDPAVVDLGGRLLEMQNASPKDVYDWRAGGEVVLMPKTVSAAQANAVKSAMRSATPAATLAATEPMLPAITVLGGPNRLEVAERHRAPGVPNVLIDRNQVLAVPALAERGQPIRDMRIFHVTEFPYVNGEPDYSRAKGWNERRIVIPPSGVRAIAAVLRSLHGGGAPGCDCEVLFGAPGAGTYRVVTIPLRGASGVHEYTVDAKTLAVTSAG
jgi:hypothetical protein